MTGECNNSLAEGLRSMDVYMYVWDCSLLVCMENLLFVMYRQKKTLLLRLLLIIVITR